MLHAGEKKCHESWIEFQIRVFSLFIKILTLLLPLTEEKGIVVLFNMPSKGQKLLVSSLLKTFKFEKLKPILILSNNKIITSWYD